MSNNNIMVIDKKYIKNTLYIKLKGLLNKKEISILEDELYIIIYKVGIINISIDTNNVYFRYDIISLLKKIKTKLLLKGGNLYIVQDKRLNIFNNTYQNEYQVFKLSNFI